MTERLTGVRNLLRAVMQMLDPTSDAASYAPEPTKTRALSMYRLGQQLWDALNPPDDWESDWRWPIDVYIDDSQLFCIYAQSGNLFRVDLAVSNDTLSIGDPIQVTEEFPAVEQAKSFRVYHQADGTARWVMIAATTVLNRNAEIDTRELFDSFIEHAAKTGEYPRLDFYHLGRSRPDMWEFGTADYLAREDNCYIASGTFDDDHPLAIAVQDAYAENPGKYGASIEFWVDDAEMMKVQGITAEGDEVEIEIPAYVKGRNTRISVLTEIDAASLFTTMSVGQETQRMNKEIIAKLTELFGGNEAEAKQFIEDFGEQVDQTNSEIAEQGLIHRAQVRVAKRNKARAAAEDVDDDLDEDEDDEEPDDDADDDADDEEPDDDAPLDQEFELTEEGVEAIAAAVIGHEVFQSLHEGVNALSDTVTALVAQAEAKDAEIQRLQKNYAKVVSRIKVLEQDEDERQKTWEDDLPTRRRTPVTVRPRKLRNAPKVEDDGDDFDADEDGGPYENSDDVAASTLDQIPAW